MESEKIVELATEPAETLALTGAARDELNELGANRSHAEQAFTAADRELMRFVRGVLHASGIDPGRITGIDFDKGELVLTPETAAGDE